MSADRNVTATFSGGDTTTPDQALTRKRTQDIDKLSLTDTASEASTLSAQATVNVPAVQKRLVKSRKVRAQAAAGRPVKLRLKFAKKTLKAIKSALADGKHLKATIHVTATDAAGNAATATTKVKLTN
jgi:hypothetical protein